MIVGPCSRACATAGLGGLAHRQHVHAVDRLAGDAVGLAAAVQLGARRGALHRGAHAVLVVLDHVDHRQLPQGRHVEGLVDLALVDRAVAEVGHADAAVLAVLVRERDAGAERHAGADDAVAAIEVLVAGEHVHRAALALGVAGDAAGELGHHAARVHAGDQHVAVVAIGGDHRIAVAERVLHADRDRFLADVEVAEAADQAHAVELARLLLEAPDQQHLAIVAQQQLAVVARQPPAGYVVLGDDGDYLTLRGGHDRISHSTRTPPQPRRAHLRPHPQAGVKPRARMPAIA